MAGKVVFVFPGQGTQWPGMADDLMRESPVFAASMRGCDRALAPHTGWSLLDVLRGTAWLDRVDMVQPALFATMVSLAALWRAHGVEPAATVGHSQGEIAAAYVSGALSLGDAARIVALRSAQLRSLAGGGGMLWVAASIAALRPRLTGGLSVAAVNGPASVVVSGDMHELAELRAALHAAGDRTRMVPVDYASHSPGVEPIRARLLEVLAPTAPRPARVPMYSTVTGERIDTTGLDADYWYRNLRQVVELQRTVVRLAERGHDVFAEIAPHPVLSGALKETLSGAGVPVFRVVGSLRRGYGGVRAFLEALRELRGHPASVEEPRHRSRGRQAPPGHRERADHERPAPGPPAVRVAGPGGPPGPVPDPGRAAGGRPAVDG